LQGTFGLVLDSLVSAEVVTATGDLIEVSACSNADLFWGIRGAGANFGIITSATYKLAQPVNGGEVFHAELLFSADLKSDYFDVMQSYQDQMPSELGFSSALFWNATTNSVSLKKPPFCFRYDK
jgi:FAD/FMN-containing dehydrogenase